MRRFNLIEEQWIPVRLLDGGRKELGIQDALLQSQRIEAIEDSSPLVVAALHRFLLAVLYRALEGPTDIGQARKLFNEGLPADRITAYLKTWRDRFWLLDEKYPFGQNPNLPTGELEPWTKLTAEYNATSNKVLFDHTDTRTPGERTLSECARWLLSTMNFSISGGRGYYPSPSPNAMICIPLGRNLHQTLCYCLVPYPNREVMAADTALWEREPKKLPLDQPKRIATGYADAFTWQARMVRLQEGADAGVAVMRFVAGEGFENVANFTDPMQPCKVDKTEGKLPVRFSAERGTWRDFDSLLPDAARLAPLTMENAVRLAERKPPIMPKSILVLGLRYEPPSANVDFWRMERFAMPQALAEDRAVRAEISELLSDAEDAKKSLWAACACFAENLLCRGERKPDKKDIRHFVDQMPVLPIYWSILEMNFHDLLGEFALDRGFEELRWQWLKSVRDAFKTAWNQYRTSIATADAWAIRALVKAEGPVRRKIYQLNQEIQKLELQEEAT